MVQSFIAGKGMIGRVLGRNNIQVGFLTPGKTRNQRKDMLACSSVFHPVLTSGACNMSDMFRVGVSHFTFFGIILTDTSRGLSPR